jgi:endonuclease YncB( thermonuclease family)
MEGAFLFQPFPNQSFKETDAFDNARVGDKEVIHVDKNTGTKSITVRVQGIDAPELHFLPQVPKDLKSAVDANREAYHKYVKEYRQPYGETATVKLFEWLQETYGQQQLSCVVVTQVDAPNDVFDVYARFIGTIFIPDENGNEEVLADDGQAKIKATDVNLHSVQQGWAFSTFYSSMTEEEINPLLEATKNAQAERSGLWPFYRSHTGELDLSLLYDRPTHHHQPVYDASRDTGNVIFPKLFRRLCNYTALQKAGIIDMTFKQFLQKEREYCFLMSEFLEQGATASTPHPVDEFIDDNGNLVRQTYDLVFQEKASTLRDKDSGQVIKNWW